MDSIHPGVRALLAGTYRELERAVDLFPDSDGPIVLDGYWSSPPAPPQAPQEVPEEMRESVEQIWVAHDEYRRMLAQADTLDAAANQEIGDAYWVVRDAGAEARLICAIARLQGEAIAPMASTGDPAASRLLASTMDERLADMQRLFKSTTDRCQSSALRMPQLAAEYASIKGDPATFTT